jgi:hypothetical protein
MLEPAIGLLIDCVALFLFIALPLLIHRRGKPMLASLSIILPIAVLAAVFFYALTARYNGKVNWLFAGPSAMLFFAMITFGRDYAKDIRKKGPYVALSEIGGSIKAIPILLVAGAVGAWLTNLGAPNILAGCGALAISIALLTLIPSPDHLVRMLGEEARAVIPKPGAEREEKEETSLARRSTEANSKADIPAAPASEPLPQIEITEITTVAPGSWTIAKLALYAVPLTIINAMLLFFFWQNPPSILKGLEAAGAGLFLALGLIAVWDDDELKGKPAKRTARTLIAWVMILIGLTLFKEKIIG